MYPRFLIVMLAFIGCFSLTAQPVRGNEPPPVAPGQVGPPSGEVEILKAYADNAKKERINGIYIPKDIFDAHKQLTKLTDSVSLVKVMSLTDAEAPKKLRNLSLWIILNWNLYDGSRIGQSLRTMGIASPEDQAEFLCITWYRSITGKDLGIKTLVESYKAKYKKEAEERLKKAEIIETISVKKATPPADSTGRKQ